ncbi:MAG: rhomboid family intramembrane serine protease [Pseudomonadota bacterium]
MFPISDDNPRAHVPVATIVIIALNVLVWALVQGLGDPRALAESLCHYALVPGELFGYVEPGTRIAVSESLACQFDGEPNHLSLFSSMFMHGSWFHLIGNMWFLWVFGDNVEDEMGPVRFSLFYLACGLAAAFAQIVTNPASTVPMVGASGAIGGVMGAYALLFPRVRVNLLIILGFYVTTVAVPAIFMLGYWFVLQLLQGLPALGSEGGGVAFWAHVGGFVAGLGLVWVFRHPGRGAPPGPQARRPRSRSHHDGRWF